MAYPEKTHYVISENIPLPEPLKTYKAGETVSAESVITGLANKKKLILTGKVIKDFGRYVLVQFEHYKECLFKEDLLGVRA